MVRTVALWLVVIGCFVALQGHAIPLYAHLFGGDTYANVMAWTVSLTTHVGAMAMISSNENFRKALAALLYILIVAAPVLHVGSPIFERNESKFINDLKQEKLERSIANLRDSIMRDQRMAKRLGRSPTLDIKEQKLMELEAQQLELYERIDTSLAVDKSYVALFALLIFVLPLLEALALLELFGKNAESVEEGKVPLFHRWVKSILKQNISDASKDLKRLKLLKPDGFKEMVDIVEAMEVNSGNRIAIRNLVREIR